MPDPLKTAKTVKDTISGGGINAASGGKTPVSYLRSESAGSKLGIGKHPNSLDYPNKNSYLNDSIANRLENRKGPLNRESSLEDGRRENPFENQGLRAYLNPFPFTSGTPECFNMTTMGTNEDKKNVTSRMGEFAVADATYVAPTLYGSGHDTSVDFMGLIGKTLTIVDEMKPNKITPVIGWGLTGLDIIEKMKAEQYLEAMWSVIESAGGIYSLGAEGLYHLSQTEYMQSGVGKIAYNDYMYNVRMYQLTRDGKYIEKIIKAEKLMKSSRDNIIKKK